MGLPALVGLALATFAVGLLAMPHAGRAAALHLMLAVGALPLIFAAMSHFIPVLTRSRAAPPALGSLPVLALAGGALAVAALGLPALRWAQHVAALLAAAAAAGLLGWSRHRRAGMLGRAHAGLAWYEAALACLIAALLAILASALWPAQTIALRRLHLHLNTLGFVGLTALGTLAVLMPTVAGRPDPAVASALRRDLPWALAGTLGVALGAAWFAPLAVAGALAWCVVLARFLAAWLRNYRGEIFARHGAAPLLGAALAGFAVSLVVGGAAVGAPALSPVSAFVAGFMLPLVSGAATQLLPVWLRPGVQGEGHARLRARLGRYGGVRAALFAASGLVAGAGHAWGLLLGAATLVSFLVPAGASLLRFHLERERTLP